MSQVMTRTPDAHKRPPTMTGGQAPEFVHHPAAAGAMTRAVNEEVVMTAQHGEPCTVFVRRRSPTEALEVRIRGEFREMPGMRLKTEQAMRLWSLDRSTCEQVLNDLVREGFLERDGTGRYARVHSGY